MHPRHAQNTRQNKSDCGAMGTGQRDCSLRACDAPPDPALNGAPVVLVASVALRVPGVAQRDFALATGVFLSFSTIPSTPPPRTFVS